MRQKGLNPRQKRLLSYRDILRKAKARGQYWQAAGELGRKDLFFLTVFILRRKDANNNYYYEFCEELLDTGLWDRLDLRFRGGYKSTAKTFAGITQEIINDSEMTHGIFAATQPIARAFQRQLMIEYETNEGLIQCYPEVFYENPRKQSPKWSEDEGLTVKRKSNPKECTIESYGLEALPTGKHYNRMHYDDIVVQETVRTAAMIKRTDENYRLSLNLSAENVKKTISGTRYNYSDLYGTLIDEGSIPHVRIAPAVINGKSVMYSQEELDAKRKEMGPYVFSCQMLLDPIAMDENAFDQSWLKYWTPTEDWRRMNRYILVDPAGSKKDDRDYTSIWVVGAGRDRCLYGIDVYRDRYSLKERTDILFTLVEKYRPQTVAYEKYGMQSDIEHVEGEMERRRYHFNLQEVGSVSKKGPGGGGNVPKIERIGRLAPWFEGGRIILPRTIVRKSTEGREEDLMKIFVDSEYSRFPSSTTYDMLDALSRVIDIQISWPDSESRVGTRARTFDPMEVE